MRILVITHAQDQLFYPGPSGGMTSDYMLGPILDELHETGHEINVSRGLPGKTPPADLAILHVDLTVVPPEYAAFAAAFPRCLNLRALDVSKRSVSDALYDGDDWTGPVIVKSNYNFKGLPELRRNRMDEAVGRAPSYPALKETYDYRIFDSPGLLPPELAADPSLVVEKFMPEREGEAYATRFWVFAGEEERCVRFCSSDPIVKASNSGDMEFCEVPDALREKRAALGFDYGKFDFVMHEGAPILLDANKTPGAPPVPGGGRWVGAAPFARGLIGSVA